MIDVRVVPGEFAGIPAALLEAGVPGVVASLWSVPTDQTWELARRLFEYRLGGHSPAAALRQAQLDLKHLGPCYWAAFTLTGTSAEFQRRRATQLKLCMNPRRP
jgi:CHAT domain-containing protein